MYFPSRLQVKIACAGRFNTFPPIAFFHMLNATVGLIRKGHGLRGISKGLRKATAELMRTRLCGEQLP